MKHYIRTLLIAFVAVLMFSSCQTKEERALGKLQDMTEEIQKNGDKLTSEDWEKIYNDYNALHEKIRHEDYNFTDEQMRELGRLEGKLAKEFAKQSISEFGKAAEDILKKGSEFLKGVSESGDD